MSEISLREYLAKLDSLLNANSADEVIHHCRHILQYFPKNVAAYRFLGRALVENGRWDEASAALQRVLSVIPDDFTAHVGLSEALERSNQPDDAIWHLERAFEQRTADVTILEQLRGLYRRYRGVDNARIPLTAAAVARQSLKSRNYAQAADTLRGALSRSPQRVDLRLLLAEILWENDLRLESAELAMDVLEKLPDCLSANRIMTGLWLSEGRPTDAQRYINRLESIDPYFAVELVSKEPVDDNAFRLDELDYRRSAQSEVAAARPDWLQDINVTSAPTPTYNEKDIPADDQWQDWVSAMLEGTPKPAEKPTDSGDDWLNSQDSLLDSGTLNTFEVKNTGELEEIDELFKTDSLRKPVTSSLNAEDPMAWLRDAGIELDEEEPSLEGFDDDEFRIPEVDTNPVAWMNNYADDLFAEPEIEAEEKSPIEEDNLPDWMTSMELEEEAATAPPEPQWQLDMDESEPPPAAELESPSDTLPDKPTGSIVPGPKRGLTAMLGEAKFDWNDVAKESQVDDDWLAQFDDKKQSAAVTTTTPEWLTALDPTDDFALPDTGALKWGEQVPQSGDMPDNKDTNDEFSWMSDFDEIVPPTNEPPITNSEVPGWLSELEPSNNDQPDESKSEPSDDDDLPWMSSDESEDDDDALFDDVPDWLSAAEPDSMQLSAASNDDDDGSDLDWMTALDEDESAAPVAPPADDEFAWMSAIEEAPAAAAVPDWLSELAPAPTPTPAAEPVTSDDEFAWLSEAGLEDEAPETEAVPELESAPDWLSELAPAAVEPVMASETSDDEFAWLSEADLEDEAPETEAVPELESAPDWLSELAPTPAAEPVMASETSDDEFAWLNEAALEDEAPETEAVPELESAPAWLSELAPTPAAEPVMLGDSSDDELSWLSETELEDEVPEMEVVAELDDAPAWLSELEPTSESGSNTYNMPLSATDAMSSPLSSADAEIDWVSALEPETLDEEPVQAEELAWMLDADDELEPLPDAPETADIMEQIVAADEVSSYDEPLAMPSDDLMDIVDEEYEIVPSEAVELDVITELESGDNTPDWLNAMVPGLDVDYASPEEQVEEAHEVEEASPREFAWLNKVVDEETAEVASVRFIFSKPPAWLERLNPPAQSAAPQPDEDFPDWVSDDDADLPEWLR